MLTVEKCKKILQENGEEYSDEEIEKIRQFMYKMARILVETKSKENYDK